VPSITNINLKNRNTLHVATWNVRTLNQAGKLENVFSEMDRIKIKILGISEMKWTATGIVTSDKHTIINSGGIKQLKGEELF
jgi:hypothetical protein